MKKKTMVLFFNKYMTSHIIKYICTHVDLYQQAVLYMHNVCIDDLHFKIFIIYCTCHVPNVCMHNILFYINFFM